MLILSRKVKQLKILKKIISLTLMFAVGLSSGAAITGLINPAFATKSASNAKSAAGTLYTRYSNQTQYLIDSNNMIKSEFVMNAKMNYGNVNLDYFPQTVDLKFVVPGYNPSDLRFFVFPQARSGIGYKEYVLDSNTQAINLTVSNDQTKGDVDRMLVYEVHVYNKSLNKANFIGKSKFVVIGNFTRWGQYEHIVEYPLVDANGSPIVYDGTEQTLIFAKANTDWVGDKVMCSIPSEMFPFDARSIKVVVFASDREYRRYEYINIDKYMYPYYQNENCAVWPSSDPSADPDVAPTYGVVSHYPWLLWAPDTMDFKSADGQPVKYEFHFYKDNVLPGNFLCKAVDVTLPVGQ